MPLCRAAGSFECACADGVLAPVLELCMVCGGPCVAVLASVVAVSSACHRQALRCNLTEMMCSAVRGS
jgi:hypothetical protein